MGQRDDNAEGELAGLVNTAGKMRMLSHRAVMFALLARHDRSHTAALDAALREFTELAAVLAEPRRGGLGHAACAALARSGAIGGHQLDLLARFPAEAARAFAAADDTAELGRLGAFVAGDLLATLNAINAGIRRALDLIAADREAAGAPLVKAIGDTLHKIERLANSLRMVATNASLEAQRAGDTGRPFLILSEEMRRLSEQSRQYATNLGNLLEEFAP